MASDAEELATPVTLAEVRSTISRIVEAILAGRELSAQLEPGEAQAIASLMAAIIERGVYSHNTTEVFMVMKLVGEVFIAQFRHAILFHGPDGKITAYEGEVHPPPQIVEGGR